MAENDNNKTDTGSNTEGWGEGCSEGHGESISITEGENIGIGPGSSHTVTRGRSVTRSITRTEPEKKDE